MQQSSAMIQLWRSIFFSLKGVALANQAQKTEHSWAKKGRGAYWGKKRFAKKESNKMRRKYDKEKVEENKHAD